MARVTFNKGAKVARIEQNLEDPTAALKQIGAIMVAESQAAFKEQRFGKSVWSPRAPINIFGVIADFHEGRRAPAARRFERRPALRDTGRLSASINFRVSGKVVEVGTNLPYAAVHQKGGDVESKPINQTVRTSLWNWLKTQALPMRRALGFLLNRKFKDKPLKGQVPARRFLGITARTRKAVDRIVGVKIMEVR